MATREQLISALRQADASGDTVAARRFAEMIKLHPANAQPQISPQVQSRFGDMATPEMEQRFQQGISQGLPERTALDQAIRPLPTTEEQKQLVKGLPEAATSIVSGAVAEPLAGISGLAASAIPGLDKGVGARTVEGVREALTFQPISEAGQFATQAVGETLGAVLEPLEAGAEAAGAGTLAVTGSPLAATTVETAIKAAPDIIPAFRAAKVPPRKSEAIEKPEAVKVAEEVAEETGIDLFEAQQTLDPQRLDKQEYMRQLSAGSEKAAKELSRQNKQASAAVNDFLEELAPDDALQTAAPRFRDASQRSRKALEEARKEASSPIYNQAFDDAKTNNTFVDVDDLVSETKGVSGGFPEGGEVSKSFKKINKWLSDAAKKQRKSDPVALRTAVEVDRQNLSDLHNAKIEIDQMLNKKFDGSLGNTTKMKLVDIKNKIVDRMKGASPEYDRARLKFEELSPPIDKLNDSIIGKMANVDDLQLKNVSRQIFDAQEVNVKNVSDAKKVISSVDPDAWDLLMRAEVERRMAKMKPGVGESLDNIPGQLNRSIFGNEQQRRVLMAGADGKTKKALTALNTALTRASLGRAEGSPTAKRQAIQKELKGGVVSSIRNMFKNPIDEIVSTGEDAAFNAKVSALTDTLFDPKYQAETIRYINSNRGSDLAKLVSKVEALKASAREQTEEEEQ